MTQSRSDVVVGVAGHAPQKSLVPEGLPTTVFDAGPAGGSPSGTKEPVGGDAVPTTSSWATVGCPLRGQQGAQVCFLGVREERSSRDSAKCRYTGRAVDLGKAPRRGLLGVTVMGMLLVSRGDAMD